MRILVVDNYDSFVFNLVQYLGQLNVDVEVWRNVDDRLTDRDAVAERFDGILLSPGPGTPQPCAKARQRPGRGRRTNRSAPRCSAHRA